jgi:lambda family phage portal protein
MWNPIVSLARWVLNHNKPVQRAYTHEAATTGRRLGNWGLSGNGPNTIVSQDAANLRARARKLVRENPIAVNAVESYVSSAVGKGITPRWQSDSKEINQKILKLWKQSVSHMDADGTLDFYGLQSQVVRTVITSGEVLAHMLVTKKDKDNPVPLKVRLMEPDLLKRCTVEYLSRNRTIHMGIEFDNSNNRKAYHVYKEHPGDTPLSFSFTGDTMRIPVEDMMHVFVPLRPGQIRGITRFATLITRLRQLDEYEDAELTRKKIAAMFSAFVISDSGDADLSRLPGGTEESTDIDGNAITLATLEPGLVTYLRSGANDIKFAQPADVGANYQVWLKQQLREIAMGMEVTYEQLTGDLTDVNFSSIRAGLIEFRRRCEAFQNNIIVHQFCRPFAAKWLDIAVLSKAISIPDYTTNRAQYINAFWNADAWAYVNPKEDVETNILEVRAGFKSREMVVESTSNRDIQELDSEIKEENDRTKTLELEFDTDVNKPEEPQVLPGAGSQPVKPKEKPNAASKPKQKGK